MSQATKRKIISAAETLFASHGFTHTSMRMITRQAGVNLSAVNYHFGSKKNLIQAVLKYYFDIVSPQIDEQLALLQSANNVSVEDVIQCIIIPLNSIEEHRSNGTARFVQLLGRGYSESQGHLRSFILGHYGQTMSGLMHQFKRSVPNVDAEELFWRLHFALGSFVFSMASSEALMDIAEADFKATTHIQSITEKLARFVTAGISG
ncbi:TetR/AcrR family transcriptional regulator [Alteromonas facilis]|uniref:TetR/AcrR family transcriptional regulator n=1 Tax=Alteromonas facilis TaxID=2048004 RepID=UPI000C286F9F|nr:TetR/AcrR family transcriptional regulator [Alteromonas facilis]